MSSRSFKNKILTGLKVKKGAWIPKIKRRRGNNEKNEPVLDIEEKEISYQEQLYSIKTPVSIINLPTEIYLQIFSYLLFTDLYTLSCVSKFFRDLLWSKSEFTQSIWRNCRLTHYPKYPKLPPPDGMCEQQYIWITLATKTCHFCKEPYEKTAFDKWLVKINFCDHCMATDEHTIDVVGEISVKRSIVFPQHLKGCIPYTEYIGHINNNYHKYYFIQDVERIKNEYESLTEEEKQGWLKNKRKELKDCLEKIKDYQAQDCAYYWSRYEVSKQPYDEDDIEDNEDEDIEQVYNQEYNQDYIINSFSNNINSFNNLNNLNNFNNLNNLNSFNNFNNLNSFNNPNSFNNLNSYNNFNGFLNYDDLNEYDDDPNDDYDDAFSGL